MSSSHDDKMWLKWKLISWAERRKLGPVAKSMLLAFANHPEALTAPDEAFIQAAQENNLVGSEAQMLSARVKCEHIIRTVLKERNIKSDKMDALHPLVMAKGE
jgi:hypothetical protein